MKKKLLITVGAGASLDFGLPSVSQIDALLDAQALKQFPLANDSTRSLYGFIRDELKAYYGNNPQEELRRWVNFEDVLYQVNQFAAFISDQTFQNGANALLRAVKLPDVRWFGRQVRPVDSVMLNNLAASMQDTIVEHFIDVCADAPETRKDNLAQLKSILDALSDEFDIGIVTLNYDNIFSLARPDLYTGFNETTGEFEPQEVLNRSEWNFIYHAHGSIHFAMDGKGSDMHGIVWRHTPEKGHAGQATGRNGQSFLEGMHFPTSNIIAGYGKTLQMLRQPFRTYFAQVNRLVLDADALLFIGYGFGDLHLNAAFSEADNRPRPTAVLTMGTNKDLPYALRTDAWSYNMGLTVPTRVRSTDLTEDGSPRFIGELNTAGDFEVIRDADFPLSIWYGGLMSPKLKTADLVSRLQLKAPPSDAEKA